MIRRFLENHVFANLTFTLILVVGLLAYGLLPRQQDPDMNFNWISIVTALPGASAQDVEKLVTDPIEDALQKIPDVNFVLSSSQQGSSDILIRFQELDDRTFDKRVSDLRREVSNKEQELPEDALDPFIIEITSSNGFPTASVVVVGVADDENLRKQALLVQKDLERIKGVDSANALGLRDPELQIRFDPFHLQKFGLNPSDLADLIRARYRDVSGGAVQGPDVLWLLRLQGSTSDPALLGKMLIPTKIGELPLARLATVVKGREKPRKLVRYGGKPAVMFTVTKRPGVNTIKLVDRISSYIKTWENRSHITGVELILADDQTHMVRNALGTMEKNALVGLGLVLLTTWFFLGSRIAMLISIGIPFTLAGVFGILQSYDFSLNVMVLLGVVISLGMLVDDAVVVVEAIYARIAQGVEAMDAGLQALDEVAAPVTTSILTTMAAFLPLMLLPGIMGKFMRVIPMVVSLALAISLIEAFWMLPSHIAALKISFKKPSKMQRFRNRMLKKLRKIYCRALLVVLRRPKISMSLAVLPFFMAVLAVGGGMVKMNFFAMDPIPIFYVNVTMPIGTPLDKTIAMTQKVEREVLNGIKAGEARSVVSYAGQMMTETKPFFGDRYGQIMVSLVSKLSQRRPVDEIIASIREQATTVPGPENIAFLPLSGGPPVTKPISVKVRGDNFESLQKAANSIKNHLKTIPHIRDISDDFTKGSVELSLTPNDDAMRRAGVHPSLLPRMVRLLGDGEVVASFQHEGEKVDVRVLAEHRQLDGIDDLLKIPVTTMDGGSTPIESITNHEIKRGLSTIRHYNFRRTITVEAELDKEKIDTVTANNLIKKYWLEEGGNYPGVNLDFSGILDDINEALDSIAVLFLLGIGLMYMILGTQFRSYFQPLMILVTVPMAFTGVVCGLLLTGHPLSLYTLYGVVALSGIAVNSSIVLISGANDRRNSGMSVHHAIIYAARRRVVPIIITTVTTIAGLFSLAVGFGGQSLLWGPVATAIVWGLAFSTTLTLFMVPLLYLVSMSRRKKPLAD
ncbi:MAG: efflux RND transporter permease subunit [Magnetococcales bacterium]|nr:efflux RND transporter permease subunit [Magnetococcales bacterium]